mgnify:CR=1 FL=1
MICELLGRMSGVVFFLQFFEASLELLATAKDHGRLFMSDTGFHQSSTGVQQLVHHFELLDSVLVRRSRFNYQACQEPQRRRWIQTAGAEHPQFGLKLFTCASLIEIDKLSLCYLAWRHGISSG